MEKILPFDRALIPQETGYWCGPASAQTALKARGIDVAERDLARELGTTTNGTNYVGLIENVLERRLGMKYDSVYLENDPPTPAQIEKLWIDTKRSIDAGCAVVQNWVSPPSNRPRGVKGSQSPAYSGGTIYHYVCIVGYDTDERAFLVADSGFRPFVFWVSADQAARLIVPKGYAFHPGPVVGDPAPPPGEDVPVNVLAAATGVPLPRAAEILPTVQQGLRLSLCNNPRRIAYWLAQIGHESGGFQYTEEIAKNGRYAPYIGRTWIQITWESNYEAFSRWCFANGLIDNARQFVDDPVSLADLRWAGIGPAWYWTVARPQINARCDVGDFDAVTYLINGGQNGADDRRRRLALAEAQGSKLLSLVTEGTPSIEESLMSDRLYPSVSIYKEPGEGPKYTLAQLIQSIDGFSHREAVEDAALQGSLEDIDKVFRVAAGKGEYKDQWAVNHAKSVLALLERENPEALKNYRQWKGLA